MAIPNPPVPQNGNPTTEKKEEDGMNMGILSDALELDNVSYWPMDQVDRLRNKEIMSKITSVLFLTFLKWFRVSRKLIQLFRRYHADNTKPSLKMF